MPSTKRLLPWLSILIALGISATLLRAEGRLWWCRCGRAFLWAGDICSSHNSQHLFDPYSFTHLLHGFLYCALLALIVPRLDVMWRLFLAVCMAATWEVIENSEFIINRYRATTISHGYQGDTIANSMGDILCAAIGFTIARRLGFRRSVLCFLAIEAVLLFWIRDSLILNIIMLIHPVSVIKAWQVCG